MKVNKTKILALSLLVLSVASIDANAMWRRGGRQIEREIEKIIPILGGPGGQGNPNDNIFAEAERRRQENLRLERIRIKRERDQLERQMKIANFSNQNDSILNRVQKQIQDEQIRRKEQEELTKRAEKIIAFEKARQMAEEVKNGTNAPQCAPQTQSVPPIVLGNPDMQLTFGEMGKYAEDQYFGHRLKISGIDVGISGTLQEKINEERETPLFVITEAEKLLENKGLEVNESARKAMILALKTQTPEVFEADIYEAKGSSKSKGISTNSASSVTYRYSIPKIGHLDITVSQDDLEENKRLEKLMGTRLSEAAIDFKSIKVDAGNDHIGAYISRNKGQTDAGFYVSGKLQDIQKPKNQKGLVIASNLTSAIGAVRAANPKGKLVFSKKDNGEYSFAGSVSASIGGKGAFKDTKASVGAKAKIGIEVEELSQQESQQRKEKTSNALERLNEHTKTAFDLD